MKYKNTITGAIIDVSSKISGGGWQALEPVEAPKKKAPKKPKGKDDE